MKLIIMAFALVVFSWSAAADEAAARKYRNFTPQQLRALPDKVLQSEVPMMYTLAARRGLAPDADLLFAMQLNSLMYPGMSDLSAAIRSFQVDLGDKPTGNSTVWQIHNLEKRAEMQKLSHVAFPDGMHSSIASSYAFVEGTMVILDDKFAWPINQTKIKCTKEDNTCELDQLILALPNENSWAQTYQIMHGSPEYFRVTRWENSAIDAVAIDSGPACRSRALNLNFRTKEFFYLTTNGTGDCTVLGTKMPRLEKPRVA